MYKLDKGENGELMFKLGYGQAWVCPHPPEQQLYLNVKTLSYFKTSKQSMNIFTKNITFNVDQ